MWQISVPLDSLLDARRCRRRIRVAPVL